MVASVVYLVKHLKQYCSGVVPAGVIDAVAQVIKHSTVPRGG
jgi:hypothetical protein